jgi:glycosyltransferase involved in cell wall biosynthesis
MVSPPRITFVTSHVKLGGAEQYFLRLVTNVDSERVDRILLLGDGPLLERLRNSGVDADVIAFARRADIFRAALTLRAILRNNQSYVVLANGIQAALVSGLACVGTPTRVIWRRTDASYDGWIANLVAVGCRFVVGNSQSVVSGLSRRAHRKRLRVIHNGLAPLAGNRPAARAAIEQLVGTMLDGPVIAVSGRLHPLKGQLAVLECLPSLKQRFPGACLVLFGATDADRPRFADTLTKRADDLGVGTSLHILGFRDDAPELVSGVDVLTVPSSTDPVTGWREGFPNAAVEAMAVGVPVIGYDHGPFREILGKAAVLVPEGDVGALKAALHSLLSDGARAKTMREEGRRWATDRYSIDAAVQSWYRLSCEAAGPPAR